MRFDALTEIHALHGRLAKATEVAKLMNDQQTSYKSALADSSKVPANVRAAVDSLKTAMDPVRTKLGLSSEPFSFDPETFRRNLQFKVGALKGPMISATAKPTETQMRQLADLREEIPALVQEVNSLVPKHQAVMKLLAESGLYPAVVKPIP
jgi:septation ring formation regulator EzrA